MRGRHRTGRIILTTYTTAVVVFLVLPLLVVIPVSFGSSSVIQLPPHHVSLRWYRDFFGDPNWIQSTWLSIRLAAVVAVLATILGTGAAVALNRYVTRGRTAIRALVLSPLIIPVIVSSIALFDVMIRLHFAGTFFGLVLAHLVLALPYPVIIIENRLKTIDASLEEAAMSLGASRFMAFVRVAMPLMIPSLLGAALFAFLASWDEVVVVLFVGGAALQTLPVYMFEFVTTEVRPTVAAASTLLIGGAAVAFVLIQVGTRTWRRVRLGGRGAPERGVPDDVLDSLSPTADLMAIASHHPRVGE